MMSRIREVTHPLRQALAKGISRTGISPNQLTLLSIPAALIAAYFLYTASLAPLQSIAWGYATLWMLIAIGIDALDGAVAELQHRKTAFGNYLDAMTDRVVEIILLAGLLPAFPLPAFLAISFSLLISYAKARASLVISMDNREWPSIGERAYRLPLLFAGTLLMIFLPFIQGIAAVEVALWLVAAVAAMGSLQRMQHARGLIMEAEKSGALLPYLKK